MSKLEAIVLIFTHIFAFAGGVIVYAWADSKFPEQATTEQHIGKQKIKGRGIKALFQNILTKKEKL